LICGFVIVKHHGFLCVLAGLLASITTYLYSTAERETVLFRRKRSSRIWQDRST